MGSGNSDVNGGSASRGCSRRRFLGAMAGLGALAGAGGLLSGAPVSAQPGGASPQLHAAGRFRRSTLPLGLTRPLQLDRLQIAETIPIELPAMPTLGEPPMPSTRQRLLSTIFKAPGSTLRISDFRLTEQDDGGYPPSAPLTSVMQHDLLAAAYSQGILLTPAGCQFAPGTQYSGPDPMGYATLQSVVSSKDFGKRLCMATIEHPFPGAFFSVLFNTPGQPESKLSYALELSMEPFDPLFDCFLMSSGPPGTAFQSARVNFVPTNEGTQLALVEIRGSGAVEGYAQSLHLWRGKAGVGLTYFNWLNIIAL
jgi:hypothetical protein